MRIGAYRFRPGLWPSLATLLLLPLLLSLGFWQLDRAGQKQAVLDAMEAAQRAEPLRLAQAPADLATVRYRRAEGIGTFDGERQFLLENQIRDGAAGYLVLTPFLPRGGGPAVLVDRGWVAAPVRRSELPETNAPTGEAAIAGTLDQGPAVGLTLGEAASERSWPQRLQYLDFEVVAERLPYPVRPYLLRLDPDLPGGYRRDWRPAPQMGPQTHYGYAVQWFGLSLALVVIYLVVNLKRDGDRSG